MAWSGCGQPRTWQPLTSRARAALEDLKGQTLFLTMYVHNCKGLPPKHCSGVHVQWKLGGDSVSTPKLSGRAMNPEINWRTTKRMTVTDEFIKSIKEDTLELQVLANVDGADEVMLDANRGPYTVIGERPKHEPAATKVRVGRLHTRGGPAHSRTRRQGGGGGDGSEESGGGGGGGGGGSAGCEAVESAACCVM